VDAPAHLFEDGATVDQLPLEILVGPAVVAYLPRELFIDASHLSRLALLPGTQRLLLRTQNSELWARGETKFQEDYVALTPDAAHWVVDQGIRLIGVDYLSVERYGDKPLVHRILLGSGVVVLEGLNLHNVSSGLYELICLPVRLGGADGAPTRAILRSD